MQRLAGAAHCSELLGDSDVLARAAWQALARRHNVYVGTRYGTLWYRRYLWYLYGGFKTFPWAQMPDQPRAILFVYPVAHQNGFFRFFCAAAD